MHCCVTSEIYLNFLTDSQQQKKRQDFLSCRLYFLEKPFCYFAQKDSKFESFQQLMGFQRLIVESFRILRVKILHFAWQTTSAGSALSAIHIFLIEVPFTARSVEPK